MDNLIQLRDAVTRGHVPDFLFFWGHTPPKSGGAGKHCFSQWHVAPFALNGQIYPSAEHAMMAAKARCFGDQVALEQILAADTPKRAKELGRQVKGFDAAVWREAAFDAVVEANTAKFTQHPDLGALLVGTGVQVLVEASPVDPVWGIGLAEDHPHASQPLLWPGENGLGFALMKVRRQLIGHGAAAQD